MSPCHLYSFFDRRWRRRRLTSQDGLYLPKNPRISLGTSAYRNVGASCFLQHTLCVDTAENVSITHNRTGHVSTPPNPLPIGLPRIELVTSASMNRDPMSTCIGCSLSYSTQLMDLSSHPDGSCRYWNARCLHNSSHYFGQVLRITHQSSPIAVFHDFWCRATEVEVNHFRTVLYHDLMAASAITSGCVSKAGSQQAAPHSPSPAS